jgi:hypothetical protein
MQVIIEVETAEGKGRRHGVSSTEVYRLWLTWARSQTRSSWLSEEAKMDPSGVRPLKESWILLVLQNDKEAVNRECVRMCVCEWPYRRESSACES